MSSNFPSWDASYILDAAEELRRDMEAAIKKSTGLASELKREITEEKMLAGLLGDGFCSTEKLAGRCRRTCFELNICWSKVIGSAGRIGEAGPAENPGGDMPEGRCAEVFSDGGILFARTEMLPGRLSYEPIKGQRNQINSYNKMLGADLEDPVRSFALAHQDFMAGFTEVNVDFLFVYNTDNPHKLLDSDSHDIKKTLDAVCRFFPHGDSSIYCSVTVRTVMSRQIPEGTYITAVPGIESKISRKDVVEAWSRHFGAVSPGPEQ